MTYSQQFGVDLPRVTTWSCTCVRITLSGDRKLNWSLPTTRRVVLFDGYLQQHKVEANRIYFYKLNAIRFIHWVHKHTHIHHRTGDEVFYQKQIMNKIAEILLSSISSPKALSIYTYIYIYAYLYKIFTVYIHTSAIVYSHTCIYIAIHTVSSHSLGALTLTLYNVTYRSTTA